MGTEAISAGDVFGQIRSACRATASRAVHVRIRADRVDAYAAALAKSGLALPPVDSASHVVGEASETVAYFLTLAAVNFGSGYFPYLAKRQGMSGYYTLASRLADRFHAGGPIPAAELRGMSPHACAALFEQDMTLFPTRELMGLFARAWNDLGHQLVLHHGGRFERFVAAAEGSAARLVEILARQPFFRDAEEYRGGTVPFYKRAQLLASDLTAAFAGKGPGRFEDLDRLTIFADNLVPHVLRVDGLLEYSSPLADAIDREELIRPGSEEEVEIRACAVECAERIGDALTRYGSPVSARMLDQVLWHRGQAAEYKRIKRHRTRTVFY